MINTIDLFEKNTSGEIKYPAYKPLIDTHGAGLPLLYAMRATAAALMQIRSIYIPTLAQGSPMRGPNVYVLKKMAEFYANCAANAAAGLDHDMVGYPLPALYEQLKNPAIDFLKRIFEIQTEGLSAIGKEHIHIDVYARDTLNLALQVVPEYQRRTGKKRELYAPRGLWPMVVQLGEDWHYDTTVFPLSNLDTIQFGDFSLVLSDNDYTQIGYLNYPNNPTGALPPIKDFMNLLNEIYIYNEARIAASKPPLMILFDNPYYGWCRPETLRKHGFLSITKIAQEFEAKNPGKKVLPYLIEVLSLGKILGMASTGGSVSIIGDPDLNRKMYERFVRATNLPGRDKQVQIQAALESARIKDLIIRAKEINDNLKTANALIDEAIKKGAPFNFYGNQPLDGAYISLKIDPSIFEKVIQMPDGRWLEITNSRALCIYLLEGPKPVAVAANSDTDIPMTLRLFIDNTPENVEQGVKRMIAGLQALQSAPRVMRELVDTADGSFNL